MKRYILQLSIAVLLSFVSVAQQQGQSKFSIIAKHTETQLLTDKKDFKVVQIAANLLANDIFNISGKTLLRAETKTENEPIRIIAGTIGYNRQIDEMITNEKVDVSKIKNQWEHFTIQVVKNPIDGIKEALVVIGSDRRGTAYGILEVSRLIGVSPWEWWADVTPKPSTTLSIAVEHGFYQGPTVKYRGVFLNDEDWGLQRWAALNYEPETGDMGPKTYAKVFELLLRLRANTIWPAMHRSTKPFYSFPKNKEVADDYAIVIGSSHAEPMLCNINTEWEHETMGEYRYDTNSEVIKKLFTKRVKETAKYEGIYTTGMRGEHDSPMIVGEDDTDEQVKLLEKIITDQRNILKKETKQKPTEVPQAFVPYKEVLKYYQNGLNLPEDITLVWTDDNYGYIRQLSTPEEQERSGGAGVYYHTSYWGRPHDYLWLNSTNPILMWEEMAKAYEFKSRDLWILNCGDIKPHEYNMELFLDMAWNMNNFKSSTSVKKHTNTWATREFGADVAPHVTEVLTKNDQLAFMRRPEFMAWSSVEPVTKSGETTLTQFHYGDEVMHRIKAYEDLVTKTEALYHVISDIRKDAFYQLVYYPVIGAAKLNEKWLYNFKNDFTAKQGKLSANYYAAKSAAAYQRIVEETNYYNYKLKNGKWKHIMAMSPRGLPVFTKPEYTVVNSNESPSLGLALEGYQMEVNHTIVNSFADVLPVFNSYTDSRYFIDAFLKGQGQVSWQAIPRAPWIKISETKGTFNSGDELSEKRLWVSIDWDNVPKGEHKKEAPLGHDFQLIPPSYKVNSAIDFITEKDTITIGVSVFNPKFKVLENYKGFVEDKGYVSIHAEHYTRQSSGTGAQWEIVEGLGYSGKVIRCAPKNGVSTIDLKAIKTKSPALEYDFYTFNFGEAQVSLQAIPTHAIHAGRGVRCAVAIDEAEPVIVDFQTLGRSEKWKQNVLKNASIETVSQIVNTAGKHTLKIWMVDSGVMLDQILVDLGGRKASYAFPKETLKK